MHLPRSLARFNVVVTNPVQSLYAGRIAPWIILLHTGRTSGRQYRTPMLGWKRGGVLMIAILYGEQSDWLSNVLAADGAEIIRVGHRYRLRNPRVVDPAGHPELSRAGRLYARGFGNVLVADLAPVDSG